MYRGVYKTANEALRLGMPMTQHSHQPRYLNKPPVNNNFVPLSKFQRNININIKENFSPPPINTSSNISKIVATEKEDISDPKVWGPSFWFICHNGAAHYPIKATSNTAERMKNFLDGMPVMLACTICSEHATSFIEQKKAEGKLDEIVAGRENLFSFFVEFHNHVNLQAKKPIMSLSDAKTLYQFSGN
jgi:hypothetical protein